MQKIKQNIKKKKDQKQYRYLNILLKQRDRGKKEEALFFISKKKRRLFWIKNDIINILF